MEGHSNQTNIHTSVLRNAKAIKAVKFSYVPTFQIRELLETFRAMVNDAISICLAEQIRGRLALRNRIYKEFQVKYQVASRYPYSVAEVAWSIVKKHRKWSRKPFARRLMMKMDSENYSLNHSILSLPFRRGERILIPLNFGNYQRSLLADTSLKVGSVTLTDSDVIITLIKTVSPMAPLGRIGVDLNERSLVCSDGTNWDLSQVSRLHTEYGIRRSRFNRRHPHDRRLMRSYAGSRREKRRIRQFLHRTAKEIVERAKERRQAIVLEGLKGLHLRHRRGNGASKGARRRINQWPFHILQAYVVYKASWEGVPVEFVDAAFSTLTCHSCGYINRTLGLNEREWRCPSCGAILDRDLNAAINIERRGKTVCLGEVRPGAQGTYEAMKEDGQTRALNPQAEALKSGAAGLVRPDRTV